jgi:hypothetical protein
MLRIKVIEREITHKLTEFGYNERTFPGPAITNVDWAESLKHSVRITMNLRSLTPSKRTAVGQENNEDNTSNKNKSHKGENTQQSL